MSEYDYNQFDVNDYQQQDTLSNLHNDPGAIGLERETAALLFPPRDKYDGQNGDWGWK